MPNPWYVAKCDILQTHVDQQFNGVICFETAIKLQKLVVHHLIEDDLFPYLLSLTPLLMHDHS